MIGDWSLGFFRAYDKSHKSCARATSLVTCPASLAHLVWVSVFRKLTSKKNVQKGKKGEKGWGNKRKPSGHWGCGSRHRRTNIECTQSVLLSEMHLQIEKKNKKMKDLDQKKRHGYMIEQTPITFCSFFFVLLHPRRYCIHHRTDTDYI